MHGLNTYDYGARQYNPVTGRWDRMDQLTEKNPNMTPYHFCHDNPVNRVDPDGRDDYFNSSGAFMYSTSSGSNVYVNNVMITNIPLNCQSSRQAVANVMGYYAKEAGVSFYTKGGHPVGDSPSGTVGLASHKSKDSGTALAYTHGEDIFINKKGGKINSLLYDKYNIISMFEHEGTQKGAGHGHLKDLSAREHAKVYAMQIGSNTFSKTTEDYQNMVVDSFVVLLKKAISNGANDDTIFSLINTANKGLDGTNLQIVYRRTGGDTDSYDLEKVAK